METTALQKRDRKTSRHVGKIIADLVLQDVEAGIDVKKSVVARVSREEDAAIDALREVVRLSRNQGRALAEIHETARRALVEMGRCVE